MAAYLAVIAVASGLGLVAGLAANQTRSSSDVDGIGLGPVVAIEPNTASVELPGAAFDLAYDPAAQVIWLAVFRSSGPDELIAVNETTLAKQSWPLPDDDYSGFLSRVHVDGEGYVWISQPYRLIRFDPRTGSTLTTELDLEVPDALPGALDPANPLPGTWISAFAVDGQSVLVARNNVPELLQLTRDMKEMGRIPVPSEYAGAQDLALTEDGGIWAISGPTEERSLAKFSPTGRVQARGEGGGTRIEPVGDQILALGLASGSELVASSIAAPIPSDLGISDASRAAVAGDEVVIFDAASGTLTWLEGGVPIRTHQLARDTIEVDALGGGSGVATITTEVTDLLLDSRGNTWYLDGRAPALVRLSFPK